MSRERGEAHGSFYGRATAPPNQHRHAIEAIAATAFGGIDLGWTHVSPSVDLTGAVTTFLADDPATWPEQFTIAGLTYDRFAKPEGAQLERIWDQAARCAWLRRQAAFDSGPYEQAARVFRQHGYTREAEQILMAQRKHARQVGRSGAAWPRRVIDAAHAIVGYGYRPSRVLWLLAALLVLVAASLATCKPGHPARDERQRRRVRQLPALWQPPPAPPHPAQPPEAAHRMPPHAATVQSAASARCCTQSTR